MRVFVQQNIATWINNRAWLRPLSENIALAVIFLLCFGFIDFFYQYQTHQPFWKHETKMGLQLLFVYGLSLSLFSKNRWVIAVLTFMVIFLFIQLVHSAYFGIPISAMDIRLFFDDSVETLEDFGSLLNLVTMPLLVCTCVFIVMIFAVYKLKQRNRFRYAWALAFILFLQPLYYVYSLKHLHQIGLETNRSMGDFPSISENLWVSSHKTILYYLTNTLPHQWSRKNDSKNVLPPFAISKPNPDVNIIFVMGESLTDIHMSSYGYPKPTTPFLDSLKNKPNVQFKKGISAGVVTDVSLSMFFNMVQNPDATLQIASTNRNLFKMAKANGFDTYFISAQGHFSLNLIKGYLFPLYIDHYGDSGLFGADYKQDALDFNLVNYLQSVDFKKPVFVVLHQKGSHFPYEQRYPSDYEFFKTAKGGTFRELQNNYYDNSVRYTDAMLAKLSKIIEKKTNRPTYLIFTSDHGESLGENGIYGHTRLNVNDQHQVPIVFMSFHGANLDFLKQKTAADINPLYMSHSELARSVAYLLGYQLPFLSQQQEGYVVNGNSLHGDAGIDKISFDQKGKLIDHLGFGDNV